MPKEGVEFKESALGVEEESSYDAGRSTEEGALSCVNEPVVDTTKSLLVLDVFTIADGGEEAMDQPVVERVCEILSRVK